MNSNSDMFIVVPSKPLYNAEEIKYKGEKYNWNRVEKLTFLILNRIQNFEYNKDYKHNDVGDIERFKDELAQTVKKFQEISKKIFEKNEWPTRSDNVSKQVAEIKDRLQDFVDNDQMRGIYTDIDVSGETKKDTQKVLSLLCTIEQDEMFMLEYDIISERDSGNTYKLLWETYDIKKHYKDVVEHKNYSFIAYINLKEYLPNLSLAELMCYDWSKCLVDTSIGYTYKWVHSRKNNNEICKDWTEFAGRDLTEFFNKIFDISWRIQYKSEDHHPEHFETDKSKEIRDDDGIIRITDKSNMDQVALEGSFVDICARELNNLVKSNDLDLKHANYVKFDPKILDRYTPSDATKLVDLVLAVGKDKASEMSYYEKNKKMYEDYKKSLGN